MPFTIDLIEVCLVHLLLNFEPPNLNLKRYSCSTWEIIGINDDKFHVVDLIHVSLTKPVLAACYNLLATTSENAGRSGRAPDLKAKDHSKYLWQ